MIIVLSPSKTINQSGPVDIKDATVPIFIPEAERLVNKIKKLSPKGISSLMVVSPKLAEQTYDRFQFWNKLHSLENSKQAILSFKGDVYTGLDANSLSIDDLFFAQKHLIILSGLYGALKPLDLIQPYRLEIAAKLKIQRHNNLYSYWSDKITKFIANSVVDSDHQCLVNLASLEYSKVIDFSRVNIPVITPIFKENKNGIYKVVSVHAKKARGLMTNYIIVNSIKNPEEIKLFNIEGYIFSHELSNESEYIFIRG